MSETLFPMPQPEPDATPVARTKSAPWMQRAKRLATLTLFALAHNVLRAIDLFGRAGA